MSPPVTGAGTATRLGKKAKRATNAQMRWALPQSRILLRRTIHAPAQGSRSRYLDASCSSRISIYTSPRPNFQRELFTSQMAGRPGRPAKKCSASSATPSIEDLWPDLPYSTVTQNSSCYQLSLVESAEEASLIPLQTFLNADGDWHFVPIFSSKRSNTMFKYFPARNRKSASAPRRGTWGTL